MASSKLPLILNGKYFVVLNSTEEGTVLAQCRYCKKTICGSFAATYKFLMHLKTKKHEQILKEYYRQKEEMTYVNKREHADTIQPVAQMKKLKPNSSGFSSYSSNFLNDLVADFIINTMSPLTVVENSTFKKLVEGLSTAHLPQPPQLMCSKTLKRRIDEKYVDIKEKMKLELGKAKYVCTTVDIWSTSKRSFLGMTGHWIDDNFQRQSVTLACRRIKKIHSYDRIGELVNDIHANFNLTNVKITKILTDNVSNMVKAFQTYAKEEIGEDEDDQVQEQTEMESTSKSESTSESDSDDEITPVSAARILSSAKRGKTIILPSHQKCISHKLTLVVSTDALTVTNEKENYSRAYYVMGKCTAIWNMTSRSHKAAEMYFNLTGKLPKSPVPTRWNSQYDCLRSLMKIKDKLNLFCDAQEIPRFKEMDFDFLQEYLDCMTPISKALDTLQNQEECFYGALLPELFLLKRSLEKVQLTPMKYCSPLVKCLLDKVYRRFRDYFEITDAVHDAVLASVSHPFYKLAWLPKSKESEVKQMLFNETQKLFKYETDNLEVKEDNKEKSNKMYRCGNESESEFDNSEGNETDSCEIECLEYLKDRDQEVKSLKKYPHVKEIFFRYNTALSSSAPVERLFSLGNMIMRPHRRSMKDDTFEKLLFLKVN